ncbi:adenylate/guanylate cyclase domain-containing protein [Oleiharenicola lentus]|uniref:adenylate/guanylate cyclase domain-containing protein n=1 Tax=Oleiharenicola lentus TaxID=2508720 RepID=UPI0013E946BE|nr:adenylate/guanylate cyclase domain-containing protein [Oleiharenicola lentus]
MADPAHSDFSLRWRWLLPVVALVGLFHLSPLSDALNRGFFDAASRHPLKAPPLPDNSALVLVDEKTMAAMSAQGVRWPFPRLIFAQLIASLHLAGAEKVVVDFTFFEESDAMQDQLLAGLAAAAPSVVLARTAERPPVFWSEEFVAAHPQFFGNKMRTGLVEFPADADGVARRYDLPLSLAGSADGEPKRPKNAQGGLLRWHGGLRSIETKGVKVYSAADFIAVGRPIIERLANAAPDLDAPGLAAALAAEPALQGPLADAVRGKVVFVGANASGTFDVKPLPVGKVEPGVLIHWTAWTNLVTGGFITALAWPFGLGATLLAGAAVLLAGLNRTSIIAPVGIAVVLTAVLFGGAYAGLSAGWWLPPATPAAGVALVLLGVVVENFWREQRRKREIQAMFGAYVDPGVVEELVRNPAAIRLGGERREATVFFSDLAGFTDLSEKLPAEQMVEVVNAYLEETSECLHRHGAYVDKYIGDAVMAVLGAPQQLPDHAVAACHAALEARAALAGINARYAAKVGVTLEVRIGLNTGDMVVGNLGSSRKKQYTVMGDTVNLASRLEGANKAFGTGILLGEETARRVQSAMVTRPLARLRVKGKLQAIEVHTLHGVAGTLPAEEKEFVEIYRAGYTALCQRRFAEAAAAFTRALALRPGDLTTRRWQFEATSLTQSPPPPDWEPVISLDSK